MGNPIIVHLLVPLLFIFIKLSMAINMYNVVNLGAIPNGMTDSTQAFVKAWSSSCGSFQPAIIYVPPGKYLVKALKFRGKCNNNDITFNFHGTLVAPSNYNVLNNEWIVFNEIDGLTIHGGMLDAQGAGLWSCKASSQRCPRGATTLSITHSKNIAIDKLTSLNSQMFHIRIESCENVKLQSVNISAPGDSPNTDGIHVDSSFNVIILNSKIGTGDDCISMGPGNTNLWIENITCGPGHGISIGSLGRDSVEEGVKNVTVKQVSFTNTMNGLRIKSWGRPSTGFVNNILFQHATMVNVQNPIFIDQNYCPHNLNCPGQFSGVKITDVTYEDIHGSSATQVAIKFDCSKTNPCTRLMLKDVDLTFNKGPAEASCVDAVGTTSGIVKPPKCLSN